MAIGRIRRDPAYSLQSIDSGFGSGVCLSSRLAALPIVGWLSTLAFQMIADLMNERLPKR